MDRFERRAAPTHSESGRQMDVLGSDPHAQLWIWDIFLRSAGYLSSGPAAVFTMFTWDYAGSDPNNREMDIEVSRWGDPTTKNAQYVVKPFYVPENASRFAVPSGALTHSFRWEPGRVLFRTVRGPESGTKAAPIAEHVFTSGVPSPGVESVRMNLYIFHLVKEPLQKENEVVIEKFEYLP